MAVHFVRRRGLSRSQVEAEIAEGLAAGDYQTAAEVAAQIAATHTGPYHLPGLYYDVGSSLGVPSGPTGAAVGANNLYLMPFRALAESGAYDRILINVTVGGAAATVGRLGTFTMSPAGLPSQLVTDAGTVLVDATGDREIVTPLPATYGRWYFLAFWTNGTPTVMRYTASLNSSSFGFTSGSDTTKVTHFAVVKTFAAFPASLDGETFTRQSSPIAVRVRAA